MLSRGLAPRLSDVTMNEGLRPGRLAAEGYW